MLKLEYLDPLLNKIEKLKIIEKEEMLLLIVLKNNKEK
jgi:hypothetical protein